MRNPFLPAILRVGVTCAMGAMLIAAAPDNRLADFKQRVLVAHNQERALMGLRPLVWSDALAFNATKWAAYLATLPELHHDESLDVEGENLWRGSTGYYTPENMVQLWIDEKKVFNNVPIPGSSSTGDFEDVGHYTQLIWSTTGQVGCALAETRDGDEVMACRYMEGGNVEGEKAY